MRITTSKYAKDLMKPMLGFLRAWFFLFVGVPSLEYLIAIMPPASDPLLQPPPDDGHKWKQWKQWKDSLNGRLANLGVVSTLAISMCAIVMSANPPTSLLNWLHILPYVAFSTAACCIMLALETCLCSAIFLNSVQFMQLRDNPVKLYMALTLFILPYIYLMVGGMFSVAGVCGTVWLGSSNIWVRAIGTTAPVLGVMTVLLALLTFM